MSLLDKIKNHEALMLPVTAEGEIRVGYRDLYELIDIVHEVVCDSQLGGTPDEAVEPEVERGYDEAAVRNVAMHYAVTIVTEEIRAAHGLDGDVSSPVPIAQDILAFLRGGNR